MPTPIERPEMEFEVDRGSFTTSPDQFRIEATSSIRQPAADPQLGRMATWRERRQSDRASEPATESQPAPAPEPAASPEPAAELAVATPPPVAAPDPSPRTPPPSATSAAEFRLSPSAPVQPEYPREAFLDRVEGWVDIEFVVAPDGRVQEARVVDAEPRRVFDKSALRAAHRWQFEPPAAAGLESPQRGIYRFEFNMDG